MPPAKTGSFIFAHSLRRVRVFSPKCPVRLLSCFFSGSFKNILFYFTKNPGNYKNGELYTKKQLDKSKKACKLIRSQAFLFLCFFQVFDEPCFFRQESRIAFSI